MYTSIIRIVLITAGLLAIPRIGKQTIEGWNWSGFDFVFAAVMIAGVQFLYQFISKKVNKAPYRTAVGFLLFGAFLLIWINGAVGIIGDEDNGVNMMYFAVLGVLFFGSVASWFAPEGMARTLYSAAVVQMLVPVVALWLFPVELSKTPGVAGVFMLNALFAGIFIISGRLFRLAVKS